MTFRFHMQASKAIATSCSLLLAVSLHSFTTRTALAQSSAQHDQQALTILTQTIAAGGGQDLLAAIQDFTETGTVTYYLADQVTGNVTVKGRGAYKFKIDADLPAGKQTAVVDRDGGSLEDAGGTARPMSRQNAHDLWSLTLPYLLVIAAIKDSSSSITYAGIVTHNGTPEYDIRMHRVYTDQEDPGGNGRAREARDFYIDPKTFLVSSIFDRVYFGGPDDQGIPHEVVYSNYQAENGIMVPLTIEESVQNTNTTTLTLNQATFNSGLADSDFTW